MISTGSHAYQEGFAAKSIFDNPYWLEYPNPSKRGLDDERNGRMFVDGYCAAVIEKRQE